MPRGVAKTKDEQKKVNVAKAHDGQLAEKLLELLDQIKANRKDKLVAMIATHPISDLEDIVADYKACQSIADELSAMIAKGKLATNKLNKEE
jgi:hypothetical protein